MIERRTKKFVFQVYSDNIDYLESVSYDEKNEIINKLLNEHRVHLEKREKNRKLTGFIKKTVIILVLILAGVPLTLTFINYCFNATVNSYTKMQKNFERLFNEQHK